MPRLTKLEVTIQSCGAVVWLASWIVPKPLRSEWRGLWRSKIWHWANFLSETASLNGRNCLILLRSCWTAFPEAFWIRFDRERSVARERRILRSPGACLAAASLLLGVLLFAGGFVPPTSSLFSSAVSQPDRVAVVSFKGNYVRIRSQTLLYLGSIWKDAPQATTLALYSWGQSRLSDDWSEVPVIESRVAPNFFELLGVHAELGRLPRAADGFACANCAVLSHDFWQVHFRGDKNVLGRRIELDGRQMIVIGVVPRNFELPESSTAAWTVLDNATLRFSNFISRVGAVARLRPGATPAQLQSDLIDRSEDAGYRFVQAPMQVVSLRSQWRALLWTYVAFLVLALACAAWVAWLLRAAAGGFGPVLLKGRKRVRWLAFFVAKSAALTAATYLMVWLVVHGLLGWVGRTVYPMADEVAFWTFLPLAIAVLTWSIADQQKRCRVCLRRLTMPVDVGRPGSVLLNFAGTEMVCEDGHGMLYVPESESNSLERDRWRTLDESWAELFRAG
jgi:MacB-like periplasmic core domain